MNNIQEIKHGLSNPQSQSSALVARENRVSEIVKAQESEYINLWGGREKANRFMQTFVSALITNPKLAECKPASIKKAGIDCAIAGLTPGNVLGEAWFIPYGGECNFQIGYPGYRKMFYRSPLAKGVKTWCVHQNDFFDDHGNYHDYPEFVPNKEDRGALIGFFAVAELSTGYKIYHYMTVKEVKEWMVKYAKGYNRKDSAWQTNFSAMGKKTVLLRVLDDCPMEDIQQQITREMSTPNQEVVETELMGDGEVRDPNEIMDDIEVIKGSIRNCYYELRSLIPADWTDEEIITYNEKFLGVMDSKQCQNVSKLKELLAFLQNKIESLEVK